MLPGVALALIGLIGQLALLGVAGGLGLMALKVVLALLVIVGVQLVVVGAAAEMGAERERQRQGRTLNAPTPSLVARWVAGGSAAKKGFVAGSVLIGVGTAVFLWELVANWGASSLSGTAASVLVLSSHLAVVGIALWFDALFLSLFFEPEAWFQENSPMLEAASSPTLTVATATIGTVVQHIDEETDEPERLVG